MLTSRYCGYTDNACHRRLFQMFTKLMCGTSIWLGAELGGRFSVEWVALHLGEELSKLTARAM